MHDIEQPAVARAGNYDNAALLSLERFLKGFGDYCVGVHPPLLFDGAAVGLNYVVEFAVGESGA